MENKKKVLLCGASCNYTSEDAAVDYEAYEADIEGVLTGQRFITVFEGDMHIFISRDLDESGDVTYKLIESDVKTGKMKVYYVGLQEERDMDGPLVDLLKQERKIAFGETK